VLKYCGGYTDELELELSNGSDTQNRIAVGKQFMSWCHDNLGTSKQLKGYSAMLVWYKILTDWAVGDNTRDLSVLLQQMRERDGDGRLVKHRGMRKRKSGEALEIHDVVSRLRYLAVTTEGWITEDQSRDQLTDEALAKYEKMCYQHAMLRQRVSFAPLLDALKSLMPDADWLNDSWLKNFHNTTVLRLRASGARDASGGDTTSADIPKLMAPLRLRRGRHGRTVTDFLDFIATSTNGKWVALRNLASQRAFNLLAPERLDLQSLEERLDRRLAAEGVATELAFDRDRTMASINTSVLAHYLTTSNTDKDSSDAWLLSVAMFLKDRVDQELVVRIGMKIDVLHRDEARGHIKADASNDETADVLGAEARVAAVAKEAGKKNSNSPEQALEETVLTVLYFKDAATGVACSTEAFAAFKGKPNLELWLQGGNFLSRWISNLTVVCGEVDAISCLAAAIFSP
jgi:hypothetical protein